MEQEDNRTQEPDLGQFKSVNALMDAYRSLQAEFTKKSQKVKELEEKHGSFEALYSSASQNEEVKGRIIEDYLKSLKSSALPKVQGGGVCALPDKPKTLREAGKMAEQWMKGV